MDSDISKFDSLLIDDDISLARFWYYNILVIIREIEKDKNGTFSRKKSYY